jgi:hypothetical protein
MGFDFPEAIAPKTRQPSSDEAAINAPPICRLSTFELPAAHAERELRRWTAPRATGLS